jgi:hypothetical protein
MDESKREFVDAEVTIEQLSIRIAAQIRAIAELRRDGCDTTEALATLHALTNDHAQRVKHCAKLLKDQNLGEAPTPPSKGSGN